MLIHIKKRYSIYFFSPVSHISCVPAVLGVRLLKFQLDKSVSASKENLRWALRILTAADLPRSIKRGNYKKQENLSIQSFLL